MTRKLREVLNVRLDDALAAEIRRIATAKGVTESEAARVLLGYGAEVERRLEAERLQRHYAAKDDERPGVVEIEARWRPASDEELDRMGV